MRLINTDPNRADWQTKHKLFIFDRRFTFSGFILSLPLIYIEHGLLRMSVSKRVLDVTMICTVLIVSTVFAQIVGIIWYRWRLEQLKDKGYTAEDLVRRK